MAQILQYSPGQQVTIFLDTKYVDGYFIDGYYADGYYGGSYNIDGYELPVIHRVILPSMSNSANFPQPMIQLDTGLYYAKFTLPSGASAVGSYWVDVAYREPGTNLLKFRAYQVVVNAPFGLYSAIAG
jgi:hypothetical protein